MNLGKLLDENTPGKGVDKKASLQDLRWLENGMVTPGHPSFTPTGEIGQQDKDIKPALEMEWGYGDIAPLFTEQSAISAEKTNPVKTTGDNGPVVLFARDQMNRGVMGKKLISSLKKKFQAKDLFAAKESLRKQIALEGIVGCVAVDGRGYKSCKVAMAAAQYSPFKHFIRHVIGCGCGTPHMLNENKEGMKVASSSGNAVDDFMGDGEVQSSSKVAHCQSTMFPIMTARGDLDDTEMDQTMIDLMNIASLPAEAIKEARAVKGNNLKKVQAAFRRLVAIKEKREANEYSSKVNTSGFVVDTEDRPIEILEKNEIPDLELDERPASLSADMEQFSPQDVEMTQFIEPEFEGTDEVFVDDERQSIGDLDIDQRQDMTL